MRILHALLVIIASSTRAANGVNAQEVCTAADYADGTCTQPNDQNEYDSSDPNDDYDSEDWSGDDDGEHWSGDDEHYDDDDDHGMECVDEDDKCATYAEDGACELNPGYMTHYCAASCDTCDAVIAAAKAAEFVDEKDFSEACKDDDYRCAEWAGMGECDANPGYMKKFCRNACLVCYEGTNQFGIGQRLPTKKEGGPEGTLARIDQSIKYMQTVWLDERFDRVRHKCKNQHQDCTWWASTGECEANPKYMRTNCAPACETCDLLDIRHRCPIEPDNQCIWKPGDLNTLMETIVDDADGSGDYKQYNPKALSRPKFRRDGTEVEGVERDGPWVVLLEDFVKPEEADRLIEIGKQQGYERSADVGKEKPDGSREYLCSFLPAQLSRHVS